MFGNMIILLFIYYFMVYVLYVYLKSQNCFSGISNILCQWKFISFPFSLFLFVSLCVSAFFFCLALPISLSFFLLFFSHTTYSDHSFTSLIFSPSLPHISSFFPRTTTPFPFRKEATSLGY